VKRGTTVNTLTYTYNADNQTLTAGDVNGTPELWRPLRLDGA
jgi:hypothetical protein